MTSRIANYIRSGHPGIAIASHEEARVEAELKTIAAELGRPLHAWSATRGLVDTADGSGGSAVEPLEALAALDALPEDALQLFFVDLPGDAERRKIWEIQIRKRGRDPASFDLRELVEMSAGCTGAEIEQAFVDALYAAFANGREPDTGHVCRAAAESVPLSKLMAEQIEALRKWARGRCRMATGVAAALALAALAGCGRSESRDAGKETTWKGVTTGYQVVDTDARKGGRR